MECEACGSRSMQKVLIPLSWFGENDSVVYYKCNTCGSLQIDEIPLDLGKYYMGMWNKQKSWKDWLFKKAKIYDMTGKSIVGGG